MFFPLRNAHMHACVHAKSLQPCRSLCNPLDCSPPSCSVCGILQARIPEWVACPLPGESSRPRGRSHFSYVSCIGRQKQPGNPILYIQAHLIFSFDTLSRICVSTHIHVAESLRVQLKIYIHKCFHDFKKCENS